MFYCVKTAWKKFKDLLSVLCSRRLSFKTCGHVYSSCVWSPMLHASETWPLTKPNLQRLHRNVRAMIRQICSVRPQDIVTTRFSELLVRLGIEDMDLILKERRLRWNGHVKRSSGAGKTAFDIQVDGKRGLGRIKMSWKQLTEGDYRKWKLSAINPHEPASVAQLDAPSYWRPGGHRFNPCRGRQHSFVEIDHEIFSTVIPSLPLIQEGHLSVSGERMCTILVNSLED